MQPTEFTRVTSPAPREAWRSIVQASPDAHVFQTPEWTDCMVTAGGFEDASRLYETTDGRTLVLPMARRKILAGLMTADLSMPNGWEFGGPVSTNGVGPEDASAIMADLRSRSFVSYTIHPNPVVAPTWEAATVPAGTRKVPHVTHVLDLEGGFESVWNNRMTSATRGKIRKARRSGLRVECDNTGKLVPVFYDLYERWMTKRAKDRKQPVQLVKWLGRRRDSLRKLQAVATTMGNTFEMWTAWLGDQPVAAVTHFMYKQHGFGWRATRDPALASVTEANDLLVSLMIEAACEAGCKYYHMGESGGVRSLAHFKERYGARPHTSYEYFLEHLSVVHGTRSLQDFVLRIGTQGLALGKRFS